METNKNEQDNSWTLYQLASLMYELKSMLNHGYDFSKLLIYVFDDRIIHTL